MRNQIGLPVWSRRKIGFSLVEVTLAIGVAAFALVAIFGLLPTGLVSNQNSVEQTAAATIASSISADLRATPLPSTAVPSPISPRFGIDFPTASAVTTKLFFKEDGSLSGAKNTNADPAQNPRYRATIIINPTTSNARCNTVRLVITWPALADRDLSKDVSSLPTKYSGIFETLTMLDRN